MHTTSASSTREAREPIRVCLASPLFYPVYSGPAVRFGRYLPGFLARGVEARVFTGTPNAVKAAMSGVQVDWQARRTGELLPVETTNGVPVHRVRLPDGHPQRRSLAFGLSLVEFCRRPEYRPAVVQFVNLPYTLTPALLRLRRLGIGTVFTSTMLPELPPNPLKRWVLRRAVVFPTGLVSRVVVSSGAMRDMLRGLGVRDPIEVIPNGVDTARFRPPASLAERIAIRRQLGIGAHDPVLLFVGPITARKGVDLLLEAWSRIALDWPRAHLLLVGPRQAENNPQEAAFHRKLNELVEASRAPERIHFLGLVPNVEDYMRAADIFVFTSRREGMPNVVPEAMASGLPVISTPFLGLPAEFGHAGRHYLLAGFDPELLATRITELLADRGARAAIGAAARRWTEDHLAIDRSLDRYVELYREVAASHQRKGATR